MTLRRDPISGRLVAVAPGRARRPGAGHAAIAPATQEELDQCPFCRGREDRTPPETLRLPEGADDWIVRVVPNLYPALERQEVVIHSPEHKRSFAELTDEEISFTAVAWRRRASWGLENGFPYPHPLINEGQAAGSSLPHSHSQIVFLREMPPAVRAEADRGTCGVCEVLQRQDLVIAEDNGVRAIVHPAGRLPYELLLAQGHPDLDLEAALRLLRLFMQKLAALEGLVPWNGWLHQMFQARVNEQYRAGAHVHLEVVPRLTVLAGLELGAGIYVNSLDPLEAAERLRSVAPFPPQHRSGAHISFRREG